MAPPVVTPLLLESKRCVRRGIYHGNVITKFHLIIEINSVESASPEFSLELLNDESDVFQTEIVSFRERNVFSSGKTRSKNKVLMR